MSNCNDIVKLYEEFKTRPRDTAESENPISNFVLKQIGDKAKEWGVKKGLEKALGAAVGKTIGKAIFSEYAGLLMPNEDYKSGVDYFYDVLRSVIVDLDPDYPDYNGVIKKIPKLRDAIKTIQIEERGVMKGNSNCFQWLINITDEIEKLCITKGQSFKTA